MTTSNISTYNNTANELILAAFRKTGRFSEGETPSAQAMQDARGELNRLVKAWQAQGYHLWTIREGILFLNNGTQKYSLGPGGDRSTLTSGLTQTTLSAAAAASATSISVASISGITSGQQIGIVQDDGTFFWTTVNGAPSGSTVTLTAGLTSSAASGNTVYTYTSKVTRPSRIIQARVVVNLTNEIEMTVLSDTDYFMQSNKNASGVPTQYYYQPNLDNGLFYVWPTSNSSNYAIKFTFESELEDISTLNDNPQFPQEWLRPLVWNLAQELMLELGVDQETKVAIAAMAQQSLDETLAYDQENASIILQPFPNYSSTLLNGYR